MGGPDEKEIEDLPAFRETVPVSVSLIAPMFEDDYESIWQIQDGEGNRIGETFSVSVRVVAPTPVPIPTPFYLQPSGLAAAPIGCSVTFRWSWTGDLDEDMWFAVRLGRDQTRSVGWTKETEYEYSFQEGDEGNYNWEIAICRGVPQTGLCVQLIVSEQQIFSVECQPVRNSGG